MNNIIIDESKLRYLIESDLIVRELSAVGIRYNEIHFPTEEDIEKELSKYKEIK